MESITNAAEEVLIDSLSFKLPGSGQYIQERRSVTFQTEGSNSYSPNSGTRVMRFKLSTEGWLDPLDGENIFRRCQYRSRGYSRDSLESLKTGGASARFLSEA